MPTSSAISSEPRLIALGVDLGDTRVFPLEITRSHEQVDLSIDGCGHGLIWHGGVYPATRIVAQHGGLPDRGWVQRP